MVEVIRWLTKLPFPWFFDFQLVNRWLVGAGLTALTFYFLDWLSEWPTLSSTTVTLPSDVFTQLSLRTLHGFMDFIIARQPFHDICWETHDVLQAPRRSHATPLLNTLHWLPVQQRMTTRWFCWLLRSAARRRRPTFIAYSRTERTSTICDDDWPLQRCADRSPRQQSQSVHTAAQHQPSGTFCQIQFWTVTL